jgi:hypothetical protein
LVCGQHPFLIKTLAKLGRREYLQPDKGHLSNIVLIDDRMKISLLWLGKSRMSTFTITPRHYCGNSNYDNKATKENKNSLDSDSHL